MTQAPAHELEELLSALAEMDEPSPAKATSMRLPEPLQRAAAIAVELGMDVSITAATTNALSDRVRGFAREQAFALHFRTFPEDVPRLADVVARRVEGTDHVAVRRPDLVDAAVKYAERQRPEWATSGNVDATVDLVLDLVEAIDDINAPPPRAVRGRKRIG